MVYSCVFKYACRKIDVVQLGFRICSELAVFRSGRLYQKSRQNFGIKFFGNGFFIGYLPSVISYDYDRGIVINAELFHLIKPHAEYLKLASCGSDCIGRDAGISRIKHRKLFADVMSAVQMYKVKNGRSRIGIKTVPAVIIKECDIGINADR